MLIFLQKHINGLELKHVQVLTRIDTYSNRRVKLVITITHLVLQCVFLAVGR